MAPKKEPDPFDKEIGGRVREAREALDMSQAELGRKLKFPHPSSLYRYEAGLRGFTKKQLKDIAQLLNVSIDWIITGQPSSWGAPRESNDKVVAMTTTSVVTSEGASLKPMRTTYPALLRQLYTSGRCGEVSEEDEIFLVEYLGKPGNQSKGVLDIERALKSDRYARDGSQKSFLELQEVNARQQKVAGVKRRTSDLPPVIERNATKPSNDGGGPRKTPKRRRDNDR